LSYLQQEVMLRQSEKLATLGKLSAGMAHELNNPAAASLRGAKQLQEIASNFEGLMFGLSSILLSEEQLDISKSFNKRLYHNTNNQPELDPLDRSDLEGEIETWLEDADIEQPWLIAPMLVNSQISVSDLSAFADNLSAEQFSVVLSSMTGIYTTHSLLEEIEHGTVRITDLVKSLKSYSYMDNAEIQSVDIHDGINDTLVILRNQLKDGITVNKEFGEKLPFIQVYGSELNQVWTNIIDNSIAAMQGKGKITIRTFKEDRWVVVQIQDDGPGIPEDIQEKVFDPFFTTKAPGEGTGLGLNISHNIIVKKHSGEISILSEGSGTCFQIRLPIEIVETKIS